MPTDLDLIHPFPVPPAPGQAIEVAPGILWARLPLPFRLDHVNIYFIEERDGWAVLDTGIDTPACRAAWDALLVGPLAGRRLTRLIASHCHPDHVGLAGWLCERFDLPLHMNRTEFLATLVFQLGPDLTRSQEFRRFYLDGGLAEDAAESVIGRGLMYLTHVAPLPASYRPAGAGDELVVGSRRFAVSTGGGHAPEQLMLHDRAGRVFMSADQVLARITPNVGVWPREPDANPLAAFLRSLASIRSEVGDEVLVLPGHDLPFGGLHRRIDAIVAHHAERCDNMVAACREGSHSPAELIPVLFHRPLDAHGMSFAFGEVLAHANYLVGLGRLKIVPTRDGTRRFAA